MGAVKLGRLVSLSRIGTGVHARFRYAALAIAWLLLWRLSAMTEYEPHASIWFPPAGLSFAALLVMGWRALPVLMGCAVVATLWIDQMYQTGLPLRELLLTGVLFGATHCASYGAGAGVLKRVIRRSSLPSAPAVIMTFLGTSCLSALAAALLGSQVLASTGMLEGGSATALWMPWWIGDMAGAQVLTPLFVGLLSWRYPQIENWLGGLTFQPRERGRSLFLAKLALSLTLLSTALILAAHFPRSEVAFGVFFLIVPQMWIVYTESPFRSALSLALFSTATAVLVASLGLVHAALVYQFAICVIATSAYFGFAVPALIAQNRSLSELALSDGLTKVATKAYFFERAEHELAEAERDGLPVSLIVLDVDHFKRLNDSFGHVAGDQALVHLTKALRVQLRQSDVVGRFGGDEFMALLPGSDLEQALATTERLRRLLKTTPVPGVQQVLSASFGVVSVQAGESVMQALKRADAQLLQAKRDGRDRVASEHVA